MICSDDASHVKGVAYFYISHTKTIPILGLTLALLQQLHMQSTTYATEVEHLESRVSAGDESHISLDVVLRVLVAVTCRFRKCYIIIDGLDECAREYQRDFFTLLRVLKTARCRLYVTSRPVEPFKSFFEDGRHIDIRPDLNETRDYMSSELQKLVPDSTDDSKSRFIDIVSSGASANGLVTFSMYFQSTIDAYIGFQIHLGQSVFDRAQENGG
jgi:hypothetical protein